MIHRIKDALSKLLFCFKISADPQTFLKIIRETKRFKKSNSQVDEKPHLYKFQLNEQVQEIYLRTQSGDIAMFYEMFWRVVYKLPQDVFKNVKTIVDLGANVGMASLYFAENCPQAKIFAVEPERNNFSVLTKNLADKSAQKRFKKLQAAIDDKDGEVTLHSGGMSYNVHISDGNDRGENVRAISMNSLLNGFDIAEIDLLKIDIEGTEKKIFAKDTDWLDRVKSIIIEFHSIEDKEVCTKELLLKGFSLKEMKQKNLVFASK
ncbi:MAG: FkbM family methyltransferase [Bacteroidota bacterium]